MEFWLDRKKKALGEKQALKARVKDSLGRFKELLLLKNRKIEAMANSGEPLGWDTIVRFNYFYQSNGGSELECRLGSLDRELDFLEKKRRFKFLRFMVKMRMRRLAKMDFEAKLAEFEGRINETLGNVAGKANK